MASFEILHVANGAEGPRWKMSFGNLLVFWWRWNGVVNVVLFRWICSKEEGSLEN